MTQEGTSFSDFLMSNLQENAFITTSIQTTQENTRNVDSINSSLDLWTTAPPQNNVVSASYAQGQSLKQNGHGAINLTADSGNHQGNNRGYYGVSQAPTQNGGFPGYAWNQNQNRQMAGQQNYDGHVHTRSPNTGDGANVNHSPCTPNPRQDYPITPPANTHCQKSSAIPTSSDYPGDFNFEVYFGKSTESAVKSAEYTHSVSLSKLFVKMNVVCPIQFRCLIEPPEGSIIRALPVYVRSEHVTEVVSRCPNHQIQDQNQDLARHLIRAEGEIADVIYEISMDGRGSVMVPFRTPDVGADYSTVLYRFMCLSSCVGGINRRPIMTVFTLESPNGIVIGRRSVEVRVCSCPGRDRSQEEKKKRKNVDGCSLLLPKKKKAMAQPASSNGSQDEFVLRIRGRDKYLMLKKIKDALDLQELVTSREEEESRKEKTDDLTRRELLSSCFKQSRDKLPEENGSSPFPT